jgi:hypothetical protein
MSIFWCARCDNLRDSDDGCQEYGKKGTELMCQQCVEDCESAEEKYAMHGADMSYEGIRAKLLSMGCPEDVAEELAREKSK